MTGYQIKSMRFDPEHGRNMVNIGMIDVLLITWLIDCVQIKARHEPIEYAQISNDYTALVLECATVNRMIGKN